jgi:hypothetical protein
MCALTALPSNSYGYAPCEPSNDLIGSIKVEVKKKHLFFGWKFSCFAAHLSERDLF